MLSKTEKINLKGMVRYGVIWFGMVWYGMVYSMV